MLAIDVVVNLAKIMLILNGINLTLSSNNNNNNTIIITTSSSSRSSSSTTGNNRGHNMQRYAFSQEDSKISGGPSSVALMIRHERSKQRRHATAQQEEPQFLRKLYETRADKKQIPAQYDTIIGRPKAVTDPHNQLTHQANQELKLYLNNFHDIKSHVINSDWANASTINAVRNLTSYLNNANDDKAVRNGNLIASMADMPEATATTQHLTPAAGTTLTAVTHKIRKLHKKKIVESLRQLNIEKFNTNAGGVGVGVAAAGHWSRNHHRSLIEAEHLQQQQAEMKRNENRIDKTTGTGGERVGEQPQMATVASLSANSSRQAGNQSNTNEAEADTAGVAAAADTDGSVNAGDLANILAKHDTVDATTNDDDDDDDDDGDDFAKHDNDDSLYYDLYQNDDTNSNINIEKAVNAVDGLHDTTTPDTLLLDDKFEKHFKNFSSDFLKDIDNNVDLDDNDTENGTSLNSWQQLQDNKSAHFNLTNSLNTPSSDLVNHRKENQFPLNYSTATEYDVTGHAGQPLLSASTSKTILSAAPNYSTLFEKEEINFNDSVDLTEDDVSPSKDLIINEAITDDEGFSLSELDEADADVDTETAGPFEVASSDDETNHFLEGVVDAANSEEIYDWDEISRSNRRDLMHGRDVVTKFLQIVETQHSLGSNCEAGTSLNLGEGVVDRYAQDRFRVEAEVAVNRANMLTRIFKLTSAAAQADVNLLHASVLSMVEFDDDIFAAGNCFDWNEHPSQPGLFCPFAYRLPPPNLGAILAKDLAMEYHYLGNTSEWFFQARKNAEKVIARNEQYLKAFHLYSNKTDERVEDDTLAVKYEDGRWSKPYYDCGGGNIWMLTYTVPFFGYENSTYHFKGTSGIDIDLRRVDIDQCPQRHVPGSTKPLNIFAGTDKCKQRTTMCEAIQGLGFRRGSYKCVCRKGYYFPDTTSQHKYFNGSLLEEEYEKLMLGKNSTYNIVNEYECLPCAEGCDSCEDGSPCIAALNWPMRTSILALACIVIGLLPPAAWFTFRYQQVKVVRAASPALLRVIALGAFFIYCTNIVMYPNPNLYTCTARIWLREIGFSLTYGALMLKTWRISVIFRVRSAKAVKITDAALLKRLGCICGAIGTCLLVRTLVSPPDVVVGRTADDLKAFLCKTDWWDYTFTSMEVVFLAWGVRLCIMVRKAPSEFNESRFISMAIYNEFLLTCFLNVSMLFLQSPANPDLLYIIFFCHTQLTITLLLALIFGSKFYIVLRSGKSHQENIGLGAKSSGAKFNFRPQVRTFANPSSVTTSTAPVAATTSAETKLSDQEALEEIRQLSMQLQRIQDMAPPKGVAVMTISSLLDGLKTPASVMMASPPGIVSGLDGNQLSLRAQKPEALPLLSLNTEMQKYQQLQVAHKSNTTTMMVTTTTNNNVAVVKSIPASGALTSNQVIARPTTPLQTTTVIANRRCEEKAVNTELIGNCIAGDKQQQQQQQLLQEHIICQRCYDKCKSQQHFEKSNNAQLDKCKILGSPQPEGSISFKNIKLDCMCSQSDDLDQLAEQESVQHTLRRITKRTAATNTPPSTTRKLAGPTSSIQPAKDAKASSSEGHPKQPAKQQICDNCKNKFKSKGSWGKTKKLDSQQHRKLSRLNSRCNILIADIESSKGIRITTKANSSHKTSTTTTAAAAAAAVAATTEHCKTVEAEEEPQYSTDDIIFYTTTDSSDSEEDDDDDEDEDDEDDDGDDETEDERAANREDDLSSTLSQSKSETRVLQKLKPQLAAIDLKCISLSMGNITTTSTSSCTSQPETMKSKNALLEANTTTIQATTIAMDAATAQHISQPPATTPTPSSSSATTAASPAAAATAANGSNNGKAKRPDKLVLNLNDRSKFTKEVSV